MKETISWQEKEKKMIQVFGRNCHNVDGLYYDVKNKRLLSFTYEDFIVNGLVEINPHNNIDRGRELKLKEYQKNVLKL